MLPVEDLHPLHQILISIGLGLLVGLQRQWAGSALAGVRTFSLVALLGTLSALIGELFGGWFLAAGFLGVVVAIVVGNIVRRTQRNNEPHFGLSTEIALMAVYGTGILVRIGPVWLAAALAGAVAVILQAKAPLHALASRFNARELKAIAQFVLISLVILPIIPNQAVDPLGVLNPRDIWFMAVLIVGLSLSAYVAYKFYGEAAGVVLSGLLGGVISSTATTVSHSKMARMEGSSEAARCATIVIIAWSVLYLRVFLEAFVVSPGFTALWAPLAGLFVISSLSALWMWKTNGPARSGMLQQGNPSELKTALIFAAVYGVVTFGVAFAKKYWGSEALLAMSVLSGITDMDAITLSTSRLVQDGKLSQQEGWPVIITAATSNLFFKGILASVFGGKQFFRRIALPWGLSLACGLGILFLWV